MNDPISWDPSLIKKYGSSNYYKLLNQLRNEVKKYPLNNKKNLSVNHNNDTNPPRTSKSTISHSQNRQLSNNSTLNSEGMINKSIISFNNAKDFSIYNQNTNSNVDLKAQNTNKDTDKIIDDRSSTTFKDRLNKIDMK
tara:strand:- start:163 stop:576 length:414 start_codon:yes stop_codon:yes gene_type:complete